MIDETTVTDIEVTSDEWAKAKCDKYDYMIATFCGGIAGLVDVFFVGDPLSSMLGKNVDKVADGFVKKTAQFFWKNDQRGTGKSKKMPESLEQCISYLEQAFPVNYDARYAKDLDVEDGVLEGMWAGNHHLLSLAHSPDPIGLIFSIINQFMGYASFVDKGKIIHVIPQKTSKAIPYMQGTNFISMLFCGFLNWVGHLISDLAGSSNTRRVGKMGRGAGIPIPFYELFLMCDFGNFDGETLAETMVSVFEEGYDARFGITMAIPVIMNELMIKVIWMIRQKFMRGKTWKESIPTKKHADLRIMLIVGNGTLCLIDGTEAAVQGIVQGSVVKFICHLNLIGWARLIMLVLRELHIRFGSVIGDVVNRFFNEIMEEIQTPAEKQKIRDFYARLNAYDQQLAALFAEFVAQIEKEYRELYVEIDATFDESRTVKERAEHSVKLAQVSGVSDDRIVKNRKELDDLFG